MVEYFSGLEFKYPITPILFLAKADGYAPSHYGEVVAAAVQGLACPFRGEKQKFQLFIAQGGGVNHRGIVPRFGANVYSA